MWPLAMRQLTVILLPTGFPKQIDIDKVRIPPIYRAMDSSAALSYGARWFWSHFALNHFYIQIQTLQSVNFEIYLNWICNHLMLYIFGEVCFPSIRIRISTGTRFSVHTWPPWFSPWIILCVFSLTTMKIKLPSKLYILHRELGKSLASKPRLT